MAKSVDDRGRGARPARRDEAARAIDLAILGPSVTPKAGPPRGVLRDHQQTSGARFTPKGCLIPAVIPTCGILRLHCIGAVKMRRCGARAVTNTNAHIDRFACRTHTEMMSVGDHATAFWLLFMTSMILLQFGLLIRTDEAKPWMS